MIAGHSVLAPCAVGAGDDVALAGIAALRSSNCDRRRAAVPVRGRHREQDRAHGLFSALYTDRGSHYWFTPKAGGKVDKRSPTQFGRAMQQLGIEMIAAYSPQARGRSERAFRTHQARLVRELAVAGITEMTAANRYLEEHYRPAFNAEFAQPALEPGGAFVPWLGGALEDILCEQFERRVGADNCVSFGRLTLQIPRQRHRCHFVKLTVRVHRYLDRTLAIFHEPRCLARYAADGRLQEEQRRAA